MSGICGICEPGVFWQARELQPMLRACGQLSDPLGHVIGGRSVLLGVRPRWNFQSVAAGDDFAVAVSADLTNLRELEAEGEKAFRRPSDSTAELIGQLYRIHGHDFLDRLRGSFAIAIWDYTSQELTLAIDPLGIETLFWSREGDRLLFGTRLSSVALGCARLELEPAALVQYLLHTVVPAPLTIYKNVERMQAGTVLVYRRGSIKSWRYWDLSYEESSQGNGRQLAETLRANLRRAVHSHLPEDSPEKVGAYLSGGTDSSTVLAFAAERGKPVDSFSIYFENPRYDEIAFARLAAQRFGARHHEKCLGPSDATEAITGLIDYFDEPFANSSAIGAYHCAKLARETGNELLLAGDGGDELFAGNERYASDKKFELYHRIPNALRCQLIEPLARSLPSHGPLSLPARYIRRANIPNPLRMLSYSFFISQDGESALSPDLLDQVPRNTWMGIPDAHFNRAPHADSELNRLLYLDVKMTLADNDIRKVRGTAEMAGVRVRFPLMDRTLTEFSGTIPADLKLKGFEKRYLFKKAMEGILPRQILYKKKHGFGVPVGYWLQHDPALRSIAAILDEPRTRQRGYFPPDFHSRIHELNAVYPGYYGEILWLLLILELWHRRHFDHQSPATLRPGAVYAS
jgi:asparagine synthase (glutamine-hydrolysing)